MGRYAILAIQYNSLWVNIYSAYDVVQLCNLDSEREPLGVAFCFASYQLHRLGWVTGLQFSFFCEIEGVNTIPPA